MIVECTCGKQFYTSRNDTQCQTCKARQRKHNAKMARLKAIYRNTDWSNFDVIQLRWRSKCSVSEIAEILDTSIETIEFEIDIAKQNAR